ncbi:copper-sensitivity suppressor membrane protein B [Salmonella enterica subsp. enterica serovar Typhi]|nr:copper-sensitivity suppressor membrane protein B [Salmonella enterica subsp. enterica serovar Typhi]
MMILFRRILFCLLWLWLPVSWAAESGWLRSPDNDHASIRLRADTSANSETRLLLDVKLENLLARAGGRGRGTLYRLERRHA